MRICLDGNFRASRDGPSSLDGEADLDRHLVMKDLAALDMAAGFEDFEPADILDRGGSPRNRSLDRILDAGGRGADELNDLVDVVRHELPSLKMVDAPAYASLGEEPTNAGRPAPTATGPTSWIYSVTACAGIWCTVTVISTMSYLRVPSLDSFIFSMRPHHGATLPKSANGNGRCC